MTASREAGERVSSGDRFSGGVWVSVREIGLGMRLVRWKVCLGSGLLRKRASRAASHPREPQWVGVQPGAAPRWKEAGGGGGAQERPEQARAWSVAGQWAAFLCAGRGAPEVTEGLEQRQGVQSRVLRRRACG